MQNIKDAISVLEDKENDIILRQGEIISMIKKICLNATDITDTTDKILDYSKELQDSVNRLSAVRQRLNDLNSLL